MEWSENERSCLSARPEELTLDLATFGRYRGTLPRSPEIVRPSKIVVSLCPRRCGEEDDRPTLDRDVTAAAARETCARPRIVPAPPPHSMNALEHPWP